MLAEAMHDTTDLAMNNGRYHGDQYLLVKFFMHPRLSSTKSAAEGRPIYVEQPYIQIMQPGNKDSIVIRPATVMDKSRFAEHYRKFEAREDTDGIEGTLLDEWSGITRSQCEELKYLNIRTVEQLANMSDSNAQNVMGIAFLKTKASNYLEASKDEATAEALATAREQIELLKAQFAALQAGVDDTAPAGNNDPADPSPAPAPKPKRRRKAA